MVIVSYNLNGIRSAANKGLFAWLAQNEPDVLCIQESKAQPEQIPVAEFEQLGYSAYIHSAERKGYSGVAIFTKIAPDRVQVGMDIPRYDSEGRVIRADFGDVTVVDVYVPSGSSGELRQEFKMNFLEVFLKWLKQLRQERKKIIVCGDFNICHKPIDINHPERQIGVSGFLPEEREWMDRWQDTGMIDTFRQFHPDEPNQYSWWSFRGNARNTNAGWRIDYLWATETISLKQGEIFNGNQNPQLSDHCPVMLEI